jgi:hypothetical protein
MIGDVLDILAAANQHGTGLLLLGWIVYELRRQRVDFSRHKHDKAGRAIIVAHEG